MMNYLNSAPHNIHKRNYNEEDLHQNLNKFQTFYNKLKYDEHEIKDIINYAGSLFDLREFTKCCFVLKLYAIPKYPTAMFLYYYSEYMIIQQRKQEELIENSDFGTKYFSNQEINKLCQTLKEFELKNELSPFMLYLYGVILKESKMMNEAKNILLKCLNNFPFIWPAWVELAILAKQNEMKNFFSELEDHWMKYFYLTNFFLENNNEQESIILSTELLTIFPNSVFLLNSIAHAYYLMNEHESAMYYFDKLYSADPNKYENLDSYSNILFLKENYCELANLAYRSYQNEKYRPETCTVIGNFYALKSDHVKAIIYFKRAIKLDYNFLSAWTLMGHEYLEMKNIPAAVESYRTAVDIDPNDYRAWYGLGQLYEIHQLYIYALYYFHKSAHAKPNDSRMWTALGSCYEKLEKRLEAIKCYEKAVQCRDKEGIALFKMAKIYFSLGDEDKAADCFMNNLNSNLMSQEDIENAELIESHLFLAKYYKKRGDFDKSYTFLIKLKDHEGVEKDEIHSMLREIANIRGNFNRNTNRNNITSDDF